jgi:hypothetical protein
MKPWLWDVSAARVRTLLLIAACALVVTGCARVNPYYDPGRPHHTPSGFRNNYGAAGGKPLSELLRWYVERTRDGLPRAPSTHVNGYDFPLVRPDLAWLHANKTEPSITWIGHATLLLQVGSTSSPTRTFQSARLRCNGWDPGAAYRLR